jgi:soluble P-type ATPase
MYYRQLSLNDDITCQNHQKLRDFLFRIFHASGDHDCKTTMLASLATRAKNRNLSSDERQAIVSALIFELKDEDETQKLACLTISAAS